MDGAPGLRDSEVKWVPGGSEMKRVPGLRDNEVEGVGGPGLRDPEVAGSRGSGTLRWRGSRGSRGSGERFRAPSRLLSRPGAPRV